MKFHVLGIVKSSPNPGQRHEIAEDVELRNILSIFENLFKDELREGLPPKRSIDHAIEVEELVRYLLRPLYHLSPAEMVATRLILLMY